MSTNRSRILLCMLLWVVCCIGNAALCAPAYQINVLGSLGGDYGRARAINADGWTVGEAYVPSSVEHGFLWQGNSMLDWALSGAPGAVLLTSMTREMWSDGPGIRRECRGRLSGGMTCPTNCLPWVDPRDRPGP